MMSSTTTPLRCILLSLTVIRALAAETGVTVEDPAGALGRTTAPVSLSVRLTADQQAAARAGRLGCQEIGAISHKQTDVVPVQWQFAPGGSEARATWLMGAGETGQRRFAWRSAATGFAPAMKAVRDSSTGQLELTDSGRPVLRYNYRTIEPGEILQQVAEGNRIYTRARSDYVHPLYDLQGEALTRDWSLDHPHHRGLYWAWPEVDFGQERGDLHALQRVFARPTGALQLESGPVFAQVEAENLWLWEDRDPIVRERTLIRAYRATANGRVVDLVFRFLGLRDGVTIARRGTSAYGGFNLRLATPQSQEIQVHTDPPNATPRRAWSDLSGIFAGAQASGLTVLQHRDNPEYPGDWIQYPELSWVQPTFPSSGTRYALPRDRALVLRFRLWIHRGSTPEVTASEALWDAWHASDSALAELADLQAGSP